MIYSKEVATLKAKIPEELKNYVINESMKNGVSIRSFMTYIIKDYVTMFIDNKRDVMQDVLSIMCEESKTSEIFIHIKKGLKKTIKILAAENEVNEKLLVIGAIKHWMNKPKPVITDIEIY